MATIRNIISYEYEKTAEKINKLKAGAYKTSEHEKYAYRSPDEKTFRNDRPSDALMAAGWTYGKVKFERAESHMSPKHQLWRDYRNAKRRATLLLAARMILKANDEAVPEKTAISVFIAANIFRSQARTATKQKSLAYSAQRLLRKLDNRLSNQPERFSQVDQWRRARLESEVAHG
jgi:hypothetical protein